MCITESLCYTAEACMCVYNRVTLLYRRSGNWHTVINYTVKILRYMFKYAHKCMKSIWKYKRE